MEGRWEHESADVDGEEVFEITSLEARAERWRQFGLMVLGLAFVWLGREMSTWPVDPSSWSARLWTTMVVAYGLVQVGRAIARFVVSVSSRQARVFRSRHLMVCGLVLFAAGLTTAAALVRGEPIADLMSDGRVSARDVADVGFFVAAGLCFAGAATAVNAAVTALRAEHDWHHTAPTRP